MSNEVRTWVFAVFQFFGGAFLDCFGSRKVLIPAFIFVTAGVFLYGIATSYTVIILAQVLMALGACCGFVGAGYIGGVWFGMAAYGTMFGNLKQIVRMPQTWTAAMWGGIVFGLNLALGVVWTPKLFTEEPHPVKRQCRLCTAMAWQ